MYISDYSCLPKMNGTRKQRAGEQGIKGIFICKIPTLTKDSSFGYIQFRVDAYLPYTELYR